MNASEMTPLIAAVSLVIAASVTGYFTLKTAKRSKSGAINTSDAAVLWDEGTAMRRELRDEVVSLKVELAAAITAITGLNQEITRSRQETEAAREETRRSRAETRALMGQITELHAETVDMHEDVKTANALTIGQLADNTESRRIMEIKFSDRTQQEKEHLLTAGDRIPDDKRASQDKDTTNE